MNYRCTYIIMILSTLLLLLTGCKGEDDVVINTRHVEVVFSPQGVGDQGYFDKILSELQRASTQYGYTLAIHIPSKKEQGAEIYENWRNRQLEDNYNKSIFIFAGCEYEYLLDSITLPEDSRKEVLMFETDKAVEGIYTFRISSYAASYLAGAASVFEEEMEQNAFIIAANPYDKVLKSAINGYRDGYMAAGGDGYKVHYLSNEAEKGYDMQDDAYKTCIENIGQYTFYFSAAGASNKGVHRFSREYWGYIVGMGDIESSIMSIMPFSIVKHTDKAINTILGSLFRNEYVPYHQNFTYSSGYEEFVFKPYLSPESNVGFSQIMDNIIEIEQKYEEANK